MALFPHLFSFARSFFTPRLELMAEILALRHQLAILNRRAKRPSLRFQDRLFWIALSRFWRDWRSALLIVKPETVIKKKITICSQIMLLIVSCCAPVSGYLELTTIDDAHVVHSKEKLK